MIFLLHCKCVGFYGLSSSKKPEKIRKNTEKLYSCKQCPFFVQSKVFRIVPTGQLSSECLFDFLNFPKNHRKI